MVNFTPIMKKCHLLKACDIMVVLFGNVLVNVAFFCIMLWSPYRAIGFIFLKLMIEDEFYHFWHLRFLENYLV